MKYNLKCYVLLLVLVLMLTSCFQLFEPGTYTVLKISSSPSNQNRAILLMQGGNATLDNSLQVSIKKENDELAKFEIGNVFTVDSNHGKAILDSNAIDLNWVDNNNLQITYNKNLRTFAQVKKVENINIQYIKR